MNLHVKTILTIVAGVTFLALLVAFPKLAFAFWIGMWVVLGLLVVGWIYGMIYHCYDMASQPRPKKTAPDSYLEFGDESATH